MAFTRHTLIPTEFGELTVVARDGTVTGVYFPGHRPVPDTAGFGPLVHQSSDEVLAEAGRQLVAYLRGERDTVDMPTASRGAPFQEAVWSLLRDIPRGHTVTYGDLARRLGGAHLARAVGTAVGRNPLSIIVPCHRVVGTDGALTGYAGGLERKAALLELEAGDGPRAARLF